MSRRPPLPGGPYLIVGLGRSGIAAGLALRARGESVIATDHGSPDVGALEQVEEIETHLQTDGTELLSRARTLIKSPGVPARAPVVAAARARGMSVLGELELGWRLLENQFIGVTGTNGKTTTVELIGRIHREAGLAVAVAGNVGLPLCSLLATGPPGGPAGTEGSPDDRDRVTSAEPVLSPTATIVCEASSFQLEDAVALKPEAAVMLNLSEDHLDRHGTIEAYRAAKAQLFARQGPDDLAVLPAGLEIDAGAARQVRFGTGSVADLGARAGRLWWGDTELLGLEEIRLRGPHNLLNAMAAAAVSLARGVPIDAVRAGLRGFAGVSHRLEEVATIDGVLYVNDSKATNVASTLVALQSFPAGTIHLILGGQGKGQPFETLRAAVAERCASVYLVGEDAALLAKALEGLPAEHSGSLVRAVRAAGRAARPGDVVLLSPACASFDQFVDFEHRGRRFRDLVESRGR
ncbi:MAG: UDP-N-acetylmuramoylalanine--D-glutamate ligase [Solirubrobacteraceae bacterium]|nr:UDP-N-acetylmuramoylalanine--D-glutamate ligase [Solirubrobacteraceae bacterium]